MSTEYQPCFCEMAVKKAETCVVGMWKGRYFYIIGDITTQSTKVGVADDS